MSSGGCLSDKGILDKMKDELVIIQPFNKMQLNTASYDVTLGPHYYISKYDEYCNPYDELSVSKTWDYREAKPAFELLHTAHMKNIDQNDLVIILDPGETILGHTLEYIGGRKNIVTEMKARSSLGRNCIAVCKCAGWGDIGYTNRWTMEITNMSQHNKVILVVGRRIAQIVFYETTTPTDRDYSKEGKYQDSKKENVWYPSDMLPKMWKDYEVASL